MFRLPYLLGPLAVLTKGLRVPLGHRAVYTGQNLLRYRNRHRHRYVSESGQLTRQDLDTLRVPAPARSQPCRLLLTLAKPPPT
jgi:hypothetical protein